MAKILVSAGPIPARLDSVKFVTNRFKGGLAMKLANELRDLGNEVVVVAWKYSDLGQTACEVLRVDDVVDYYRTVLAFEADAYVLAAAVANLMPSNPWPDKFPSHNYKVGDRFNIEFEIAPRVIDEIKRIRPRSALVGYKLFDGPPEELVRAAKLTLHESKANIVFANHPAWAKTRKVALTQDGSVFTCSFDEHVTLTHKIANERFFRTRVEGGQVGPLTGDEQAIVDAFPRTVGGDRTYGTFAIRRPESFLTTTRGHQGTTDLSEVFSVDLANHVVRASSKATLNTPLLFTLLERNPHINILLHTHDLKGKQIHNGYEFPGSVGDMQYECNLVPGEAVLFNHHGNIVGFETLAQYEDYVRGLE